MKMKMINVHFKNGNNVILESALDSFMFCISKLKDNRTPIFICVGNILVNANEILYVEQFNENVEIEKDNEEEK